MPDPEPIRCALNQKTLPQATFLAVLEMVPASAAVVWTPATISLVS
jgi:hypothetical protein